MSRNATENEDAQALDAALAGMFRALQSRALPDSLRSVLDQLDESAAARERESV